MSLDDDKEQSKLVNKLSDMNRGKILGEKRYFLNNIRWLLNEREKALSYFKRKTFPVENLDRTPTSQPTPKPTPKITSNRMKL